MQIKTLLHIPVYKHAIERILFSFDLSWVRILNPLVAPAIIAEVFLDDCVHNECFHRSIWPSLFTFLPIFVMLSLELTIVTAAFVRLTSSQKCLTYIEFTEYFGRSTTLANVLVFTQSIFFLSVFCWWWSSISSKLRSIWPWQWRPEKGAYDWLHTKHDHLFWIQWQTPFTFAPDRFRLYMSGCLRQPIKLCCFILKGG